MEDAEEKKASSFEERSCLEDMVRQEGREMATPVVMGERLDPPKYGENWTEDASRVFFAAYREYKQR